MASNGEEQFKAALDPWIARHRDEIVAAVQELCRIRSVQDEPAPGQPFGPGVAAALEWVRRRAEGFGFRTRNVDGYAVEAEIGEGDEWVAVLAHVDVVPEGSGWTYPPYGAEIHDGKIYARGAVDDKGPAVASLYAFKAVADLALKTGRRPARRARLIVGGNEESGFECVKYYFAHNPQPALGFSPDAMFPLVHAEKGIWTFRLSYQLPESPGPAPAAGPGTGAGALARPGNGQAPSWTARLLRLEGGTRVNVVPEHAVAELEVVGPGAPSLEELAQRLSDGGGPGRVRITARAEGGRLVVEARGAAAHAMHPEKGINAVAGLLAALAAGLGPALPGAPALAFLAEAGARTDGSGFGIAVRDEISGPLTVNLGVLRLEAAGGRPGAAGQPGAARASGRPPAAAQPEAGLAGAGQGGGPAGDPAGRPGDGGSGILYADCNVRYPVTVSSRELAERLEAALAGTGWRFESREDMPPHHVPADSEIVTKLLDLYREETGDAAARPLAIGGGTYARVLEHGVAFGPVFPGQRELAHEPDEYWAIDDLLRCTRIYARAIYRLMFP